MRILSRDDLVNILYGCAILGTGGGGELTSGMEMVDEAIAAVKTFQLATFDDLDPEALIGTPYACGAISPLTEEERKKYARLPEASESCYLMAIRQIEEYLGKQVGAVISTELGGHNTATAFYCGAMAGKPIVDGDPAGRSVPALQHTTYLIHDVPMCPISVVNDFGEGAIFPYVFDDERGEDMVRALAVVSRNSIAVVDHVQPANVLKDAVIRGAISYAEAVGKAFLSAKEVGEDFVSAVVTEAEGKMMFEGTVTKSEYETRDGYTYGDTEIAGSGDYQGHTLRIWYQNENIMSWMDGDYYVTVPDLICVFDMDEKMPQLNPHTRVGEQVAVIALPADPEWQSPRGMELFGPKSFGYDMEYVPFC